MAKSGYRSAARSLEPLPSRMLLMAGSPGERARLSTLSGKPNGRRYVRSWGRPVVSAAQQRWDEPVADRTGGDDKVIRAALHQVWPSAAIGLALAINLAWIAALAYGLYKLF
jgi:hypothetical protein